VSGRPRNVAFAAVAAALGLLLIEGISAVALRFVGREAPLPVAERRHTRFDAELGWVNEPSRRVEDLYGPGRTLTTNSQGFRATRDYARAVPEGRVRLLCSGDSFTLGWGVDDAETWPARLEALDPRIETVNLGQGGYGVDQAYLWALREEDSLEHQVHLFAFILEDLQRMRYDRFREYGKPRLELRGDRPVAVGVPLDPPAAGNDAWWAASRTARLLLRLAGRSAAPEPQARGPLSEAARVAAAAVEDLHRIHDRNGTRLVAVWLPTLPEYLSRDMDVVRNTILQHLRGAGVTAYDLTGDLRALPPVDADRLFLKPEDVVLPFHGRHYSAAGNEFVARALWRRLERLPEFGGDGPGS